MLDTVNTNLLMTPSIIQKNDPQSTRPAFQFISIKDRPRAQLYPKIDVFPRKLAIYDIHTHTHVYLHSFMASEIIDGNENINGIATALRQNSEFQFC